MFSPDTPSQISAAAGGHADDAEVELFVRAPRLVLLFPLGGQGLAWKTRSCAGGQCRGHELSSAERIEHKGLLPV